MLTIEQICKTYPGKRQPVQALKDVNLTINAGMFGLLGPNGAGKSSLMRTIATLQQPDSGRILFDGQDVFTNPALLRGHLGYLPQDFGVYQGVSAYELLHYLGKLKGEFSFAKREKQIEQLLEQVNLTAHKYQAVSQFSGGMKQRFGIAQALLGSPKLLIVDEPTAGLDPEERNRFHNLLVDISADKVVLLSTHIVEDVSHLCPTLAILANGQVIKQGSPQQLINALDGKIWQINSHKNDVPALNQQYNVISQRLYAGEVRLFVHSEQQPGRDFQAVKPDLEAAYFTALFQAENRPVSPELEASHV